MVGCSQLSTYLGITEANWLMDLFCIPEEEEEKEEVLLFVSLLEQITPMKCFLLSFATRVNVTQCRNLREKQIGEEYTERWGC
ncbi:hypothetical protein HZH66_004929 [Vespula vulgaris]|uniref:Uncharacterized protein n=1 Tax=Vespula vulgaris TaxID=7454 RepID=A0A834NAZ4_VESVU|nr:hypothetical protein HZH66_004929 [Vespula vulgaris]